MDYSSCAVSHRGNVYYVGSEDLASYLVTTPQGDILINSNLMSSVPLIRKSVESLGFRFSDVKILLISHAHFDHAAGSAEIKRLTGAKYMVMDADVPVVESGGKTDFQYGRSKSSRYPAAKVDRVLHDGDEVRLGGVVLVAHKTPGHTKGCTTWTMKVKDGTKMYDVVIVGSPNVNPGYKLVANAAYPDIARDYEQTFRTLKSLPCDVFSRRARKLFRSCGKVWAYEGPVERMHLSIRQATGATWRRESRRFARNWLGRRLVDVVGIELLCRNC